MDFAQEQADRLCILAFRKAPDKARTQKRGGDAIPQDLVLVWSQSLSWLLLIYQSRRGHTIATASAMGNNVMGEEAQEGNYAPASASVANRVLVL